MDEAPGLAGFPPWEALRRLARQRGLEGGLEGDLPDFLDAHRAPPDPERMAAALASPALQARPARVQAADLRCLDLPTLAEASPGAWVLLAAFRRGRFRIETAEGIRTLDPRQLAARTTGRVLDLAAALPPGRTLGARLRPLLLRHPASLLQAALAALLLQGLALAAPALTAAVLDRALPDGSPSLLALAGIGILLAAGHQAWLAWIQGRAARFLSERFEASADRGFLEHALRCPFPFLQGRSLGDLLQAAAGFQVARQGLSALAAQAFLAGLTGLASLGALLAVAPLPALMVLAVAGSLAALALLAGSLEARLQARQVEAQVRERGLLAELVAGVASLKAAGLEERALARWRNRYREVLALAWTQGRIHLGAEGIQALSVPALTTVLFVLGGRRMLEGSLRPGTFFAFLQLGSGFLGAVLALVHAGLGLRLLRPRLARAEELLAVEPEPRLDPALPAAGPVPAALEGVWFRYGPDAPWVLEAFDLRLEPGQKLTLDGPSGFGKTTVLRLLAGLHEPARGTVRVGGRPPREARPDLAYLPQFVRLFGGTLLENLRIFSHGAPLERIRAEAERTGLDAWVERLPMGYQTLLPPGAGTLSGGQRQLIALTGTLAAGRPLLLLDEATANLDARCAARLEAILASGPWTLVSAGHAPGADRL